MEIVAMVAADWERVREIYAEGIATGNATFETAAPTWELWDTSHLVGSRIVAREGEVVLGFAAISRVSSRQVYAGVGEVSVYVGNSYRGRRVGRALLHRLIMETEKNGIWTLQASIFPENDSSIRLHRSCGFREVGFRERIGKMKDGWRNTVLLERRSTVAGID